MPNRKRRKGLQHVPSKLKRQVMVPMKTTKMLQLKNLMQLSFSKCATPAG